jgi:hypothetical protein
MHKQVAKLVRHVEGRFPPRHVTVVIYRGIFARHLDPRLGPVQEWVARRESVVLDRQGGGGLVQEVAGWGRLGERAAGARKHLGASGARLLSYSGPVAQALLPLPRR